MNIVDPIRLVASPLLAWPDDEETMVSFSAIVDPIVEAIRFAYDLHRINEGISIPFHGLDHGGASTATVPPITHRLSVEGLAYHADRDRDALVVLISHAVRLGMEQGRRHTIATDLRIQVYDINRKIIDGLTSAMGAEVTDVP